LGNALYSIDCLPSCSLHFFKTEWEEEGTSKLLLNDSDGSNCFIVMYSCLLPFFPARISSALATCLLTGSTSSNPPSSSKGAIGLFPDGFSGRSCLVHRRRRRPTEKETAKTQGGIEYGT
ncbi:hypothetical protein PMAYCL1PPCAC_24137, partial [Pristionchus mayeri]